MAIVPKLIKAAFDYSRKLPETLLGDGYAVVKGLTGNVNFTALPVDLALLKSMLDGYAVTIGEARDGGKKAIASRNKQGEDIIRMLRQLATYVELNCKDDMDTFLSSGFKPRTTTRVAPQPLAQPTILNLGQGNSGELLVSIEAVRKAKHYELHYGPVGAGGATPVWRRPLTDEEISHKRHKKHKREGTKFLCSLLCFLCLLWLIAPSRKKMNF